MPRVFTYFSALVLLAISLALIFAGRHVIKFLAFVVVGLAVGALGVVLGGLALDGLGSIFGFVLGFIVGGLLGLLLLTVGVGIALGLFAYYATQTILSLPQFSIVSIIVGLAFFVIGVLLSKKILALVTAFLGAFLLFDVLVVFLGVSTILAVIVAVVIAAIGTWFQWPRKPHVRSTAPVSSVPSYPPPPPKSNSGKHCT